MNIQNVRIGSLWLKLRQTIAVATVLISLDAAASHAAPEIKWVQGSSWQVSAFEITTSRAHTPDAFELRGGFDTRAEAEAEVKRLVAIDAKAGANDSWRFAVIRIQERTKKSVTNVDEVGAQLRELWRLYNRVKTQRDTLLKYRGSKFLDASAASEANRAIEYYNSRFRATYASFGNDFNKTLAKYGISPFGELYRISPDGLVIDDKTNKPAEQGKKQQADSDPVLASTAEFRLYTVQNRGSGGQWQKSAGYESLAAARAAGERYLFASQEQRCFAVVKHRDGTKDIGDRPDYADVYENAVVQRCKPWGGKISLEDRSPWRP